MPVVLDHWKVLPHGLLQEIEDGVLTVTGDIPMPLGHFPRRMTVIRLAGRRSAIFSAIALPEHQMRQIEALGRPSVLIVPNPAHRLDARIWKQRYPEIAVLTPPGAREAVEDVVPVNATHDILADSECSFVVLPGTRERESAVVVRRDGRVTIICNDIIGNVRHPHGAGAHIMARLMNFGVHEPSIPRTAKQHIDDRHALARELRKWAEMKGLRRIVVSHGEVIDQEPAEHLWRLAAELDI